MGLGGAARIMLSSLVQVTLSAWLAGSTGWAADQVLPRLAGIVVGPAGRVAVFAEPGGLGSVLRREGDAIGPYRLTTITPQAVVVTGPDGVETLRVETPADPAASSSSAPPAATAPRDLSRLQAETTQAGQSIGRLALARDACARAGALPGVGADAETRLKAMIAAIARAPRRPGANAPAMDFAAALGAGLDAARQTPAAQADPNGCARIAALWDQVAGRYGLR